MDVVVNTKGEMPRYGMDYFSLQIRTVLRGNLPRILAVETALEVVHAMPQPARSEEARPPYSRPGQPLGPQPRPAARRVGGVDNVLQCRPRGLRNVEK